MEKMTAEVHLVIAGLIAHKLLVPVEKVSPQARLVEDLGADSLNILEIVLDINDELDIELSVEGLIDVRRVEDLFHLGCQALQAVTD